MVATLINWREHVLTVAIGASETGEIDLEGQPIVMIYTPAAVEATTAQMGLKAGRVAGTR